MPLKNGLPSLAYLYRTKNLVLREILEKGGQTRLDPTAEYARDLTRQVSLLEYLAAIEKMIEAMATLRDFEAQPFTAREQKELNAMWLLESERETMTVQL